MKDTQVRIHETEVIVPSNLLPKEINIMKSNANLSTTILDGRIYLAFRTSPDHWPNNKTELIILSRKLKETKWKLEKVIKFGTDIREPRFLNTGSKIILYFTTLTPKPFKPLALYKCELTKEELWTTPKKVLSNSILWSIKEKDGLYYLITYKWDNDYFLKSLGKDPTTVCIYTTKDGTSLDECNLSNLISNHTTVETDLEFIEDDTVITISRAEFATKLYKSGYTWGSVISKFNLKDNRRITTIVDKRKFDSPLLFQHQNRLFLIARRNLTKSGNFYLGFKLLPHFMQSIIYQLVYWLNKKRTSLWEINKESLEIKHMVDFPSSGDTCFPSLLKVGTNKYDLYNYTSPTDRRDFIWGIAQRRKTYITRTRFEIN